MGAAARLLDVGIFGRPLPAPSPEERLTYLGRYSRHIYFEPCSQAYIYGLFLLHFECELCDY